MTLTQKAKEMRLAIDLMESTMMGWQELLDLPENCALSAEDRDDLELEVKVTWGQLRRITEALENLTRIVNSPEYHVD